MLKQFDASFLGAAIGNGGTCIAVPIRRQTADATVRPTRAEIAAAVNYINRYACDGLSIQRLVKETQCASRAVFSRQFTAVTGQTPQQAIRRRQLEEVVRLLARTELSLGFIAECCGFRNLGALSRAFKTAEGQTLLQFRQRAQANGNGTTRAPSRPAPDKRAR